MERFQIGGGEAFQMLKRLSLSSSADLARLSQQLIDKTKQLYRTFSGPTAAHTILPVGVGRFPHPRVSAVTMARPDSWRVPERASSLRCASAVLASSTATATRRPSYSTRSVGAESVCRSTFSTKAVATVAATGIRGAHDHPDSQPPTNRCASTMLLTCGGSSARARRLGRGHSSPTDCSAACIVANAGT
ncbi:hypothetical protein FZI94_18165 [Mycobacterium sp. CBMA226]|nr:hypothetical protein [Mycolicibacterium sp. CBMA 226]